MLPNLQKMQLCFGRVQKLFTSFSAGTQRWSVLKKHVNITVKSWSDKRWENRLQGVHAIRYQASEVLEALLEDRQMINDHVAKVEARALAEEVGSYRLLICCVVWCEILTMTNKVNKVNKAVRYHSEFNFKCKGIPHHTSRNWIL